MRERERWPPEDAKRITLCQFRGKDEIRTNAKSESTGIKLCHSTVLTDCRREDERHAAMQAYCLARMHHYHLRVDPSTHVPKEAKINHAPLSSLNPLVR